MPQPMPGLAGTGEPHDEFSGQVFLRHGASPSVAAGVWPRGRAASGVDLGLDIRADVKYPKLFICLIL